MTGCARGDGNRCGADNGGDGEFQEHYKRWYRPLVRHCARLLSGTGDPEALAQEAFTRAWHAREAYTVDRPFWPWLTTIARRLYIDQRRSQHRSETTVLWRLSDDRAVLLPDELVEYREEHRLVRMAYGRLRPREQRIVGLRDIDGWSYAEIAAIEGASVESVRGALKRARAALREAYVRVLEGSAPVAIASPSCTDLLDRQRASDDDGSEGKRCTAAVSPPDAETVD